MKRRRIGDEQLAQWLYEHTLGCYEDASPTGAPEWVERMPGDACRVGYMNLAKKLRAFLNEDRRQPRRT